jgi:hypothetical protein
MSQWRIRRLGETCIPLRVPWIKPVVQVVGREENMEICVVRLQRQLHQQEWQVNQQSCHQDE